MYVIFINDSVIYLNNEPYKKNNILSRLYKGDDLFFLVKEILRGRRIEVCYYNRDIDYLWNDFKSNYRIIEAAGGLVFNERNESLWIYRNNKWDLPKGKIDKNESKENAALREVKEECGVTNLKLMGQIGNTYHIYEYKEDIILKDTYWYEMRAKSNEKLVPQSEEGITKVEWITSVKINEILKNTYGNIKLICKFALLYS